MVKALHEAGIEVILDVVYNHTAEGNHLGPTLCFRGIDNAAYYRLTDDKTHYYDTTGTGNSLLMRHPHVLQLIMDSLRYWVTEMHVDGFRFDLAATLARQFHEVDRLSAFFDLVQQDPIVSQVKLIAEPWDVGDGGYQVGNFPPLWTEWNGKYRDTVRDFWRGEPAMLSELQKATDEGENIAVTLWRPHWAYDAFPVRDLEDPEGAMGEAELIYNFSRTGFGEEHPKAAQLLKNLVIDDEALSSLENVMFSEENYNGEDLDGAVEEWAGDNAEFFENWKSGSMAG